LTEAISRGRPRSSCRPAGVSDRRNGKVALSGDAVIPALALGRSWRSATPAQRRDQELFAVWTINGYEHLLGANKGGRLTIIGAQPIGGTDALVHTKIDRLNGTPVEIDLRVCNTHGQMKIVDVIIGGASMA
jgi:ABC-type transporter MlaC component